MPEVPETTTETTPSFNSQETMAKVTEKLSKPAKRSVSKPKIARKKEKKVLKTKPSKNGKPKAKHAVKCLCGCGETTGSRFAPGHDAKLKSRLLAAHRGKGMSDKQKDLVKELGWSKLIKK